MCMSFVAWMFMSMPGVHRGHKKVSGLLELTIVSHHVNVENKTQVLRKSTAILSDLNSWVISLAQQRRNFYKITCNLIQVFWSSLQKRWMHWYLFNFYLHLYFACMYVCTTYTRSTHKGRRCWNPGTVFCGCWEPNLSSLKELLTTKPSFQSSYVYLGNYLYMLEFTQQKSEVLACISAEWSIFHSFIYFFEIKA